MFKSGSSVANLAKRNFSTSSKKERVFIVGAKRTPFGKFGESLKDITPVDLAVISSKAALKEANISDPSKIDHVIFANVLPSTTDTLYGGRHVALKVGAPVHTPAYNVNRLCGSGLQAIADARDMIQRGEASCVLAAGSENMSLAPHLVWGSRFGTKYGSLQTGDMLLDALTDKYGNCPMGITAENLAEKYKITREESDQFGLRSHQLAAAAYKNNKLQGELTPVALKKGELTQDENVRHNATLADVQKLKASFKKDGTVTPGTASGIVDGGASVVVVSESFCQKHGITPLAEVGESAVIGVEPSLMGFGPVPAVRKLFEKTGLSMKDVDLVELNEAFAPQALSVAKELGIDMSRLNIWGGAIAIGHPLGASGLRIAGTLSRQLKDTNGKTGIATACIGGGQGMALLIKAVSK
eukprot:TRINITY_DN1593_c0_g2_i1.p1 TRINITY_DN1593_c0_g2~~TRINITY_DN1593_c0_g2_i1.p1  ORF type:complete len:413 (-),score=111.86 TRINITY_DN1593_c0_g2_i1:53-1291(-)